MLFAVTMVKDEADIIEYTIRHLLACGVDRIVLLDNLSTDATPQILEALQKEFGAQIQVMKDEEPAFYQAQKMTSLFDYAVNKGAKWVIPFDADELWCCKSGNLARELMLIPREYDGVQVPMLNHFPTYVDGASLQSATANPFCIHRYRHFPQNALPKVAIRANPDVLIMQGNHSFTRDLRPVVQLTAEPGFHIRHFPYRSADQFVRKAFNGAEAYKLTNLPKDQGAHWRAYGEAYAREGEVALRSHFNQWFYFGADRMHEMVFDPAPYRG